MKIQPFIRQFISFCEREKIEYALIGAFAMQAHGYIRATRDIDFVVRLKSQTRIIPYLESLGFETLHRSDGYSNHLHPIGSLRVDFVYVDDATAEEIFKETKQTMIFKNISVPVVKAEHLVKMKLWAAKNAPERLLHELADIKELVKAAHIDKALIKQLFEKQGLGDRVSEVCDVTYR
jgi:hypothetical protein